MRSSLLMATFNGEKYIKQQLDSIRCQTKSPDEVIICDDCSIDSTKSIVLHYISEHQLGDTWKFLQNKENLGFRKNFQKLIYLANNEIIFLSDQDDIWNNEKLELMMNGHKIINKPGVFVSDVKQLVDKDSRIEKVVSEDITSKIMIDEYNHLFKIQYTKSNLKNRRPGWSFSFSKQLVPNIIELMSLSDTIFHDEAIWYSGLLKERLFYINKVTGDWRKFSGSETTRKLSFSKLKETNINYFKHTISNLEVLLKLETDESKNNLIQNEIRVLKLREDIILNGNFLRGINCLLKNKNIKQSSLDLFKSIIIRVNKH